MITEADYQRHVDLAKNIVGRDIRYKSSGAFVFPEHRGLVSEVGSEGKLKGSWDDGSVLNVSIALS